jgi:hypothetical protein
MFAELRSDRQPPTPTKKLTPRDLVAVVLALEGKRVDLWRAGLPTADVDAQLQRARTRLWAAEFYGRKVGRP